MSKRIGSVLVAVGMAAAALLPLPTADAAAPAAEAQSGAGALVTNDPFDGDCADRRPKFILRLYEKQGHDILVPLRCGAHYGPHSGWEYRHIKQQHGFNATKESWMELALLNPDRIRHRSPTARRYIKYIGNSREIVVGWDFRHEYEGDAFPQKGIITCFTRWVT